MENPEKGEGGEGKGENEGKEGQGGREPQKKEHKKGPKREKKEEGRERFQLNREIKLFLMRLRGLQPGERRGGARGREREGR